MLVAHNPVCKLPLEERHQSLHSQQCAPLSLTMRSNLGPRGPMSTLNPVVVKQEPLEDDDDDEDEEKAQHSVIKPICLGGGMYCSDGDSLNTPVVAASTPVSTPNNPSLIFTYPSMLEPESPSPSSESCSKAHRRSSSSGDQSSDSLNSPTLLALWRKIRLSSFLWISRARSAGIWVGTSPQPSWEPSRANLLVLFKRFRREFLLSLFKCTCEFHLLFQWRGFVMKTKKVGGNRCSDRLVFPAD